MHLHALEPHFKFFYTFVCKNVSSCRLEFSAKIADKYVENLNQAVWRKLSIGTAPKICWYNPLL